MPLRDHYWRDTPLSEMSHAEWEALCDGCGLCCLHKLEDVDTAEISYTNVACRLLDCTSCRCSNYPHRKQLVPDCVVLSPDMVAEFPWLPKSCAYRRVADGRDLAPWHPLVSGSPDTVHEAGISGRGRVISERDAGPLEEHIVHWEDDGGAAT